jgi:hypothetical protein
VTIKQSVVALAARTIFGRPVHEILDQRAAIASFLLARARDAYAYVVL